METSTLVLIGAGILVIAAVVFGKKNENKKEDSYNASFLSFEAPAVQAPKKKAVVKTEAKKPVTKKPVTKKPAVKSSSKKK